MIGEAKLLSKKESPFDRGFSDMLMSSMTKYLVNDNTPKQIAGFFCVKKLKVKAGGI